MDAGNDKSRPVLVVRSKINASCWSLMTGALSCASHFSVRSVANDISGGVAAAAPSNDDVGRRETDAMNGKRICRFMESNLAAQ